MQKIIPFSLVALTTLLLLSANVSADVKGTKKGTLKTVSLQVTLAIILANVLSHTIRVLEDIVISANNN